MQSVRQTFGQLLGLWTGAGRELRRELIRVLACLIIAWAGYHLCVFTAGMLASRFAWSVIPCLALGMMVQLSAIIIAMRTLLAAAHDVVPDGRLDDDWLTTPTSQVLANTILPFLCVYSAFGYFTGFLQDATVVSLRINSYWTTQVAFFDTVDPFGSLNTFVIVAVACAALWLIGKVLRKLIERTSRVFLSLLAAFCQACLGVLAVTSGYRILEQISTVFTQTKLGQWRDDFVSQLAAMVPYDLPVLLSQCWDFLVNACWPIISEVAGQALLWLALVAVVAGKDVPDVDSVWHRAVEHLGGKKKLADIGGKVASRGLANAEETGMPLLHALRLVLRMGWSFLAAVVLSYALVRSGGAWAQYSLLWLASGQDARSTWLIHPFGNLISQVLVLGVQLALLASAFVIVNQASSVRTGAKSSPKMSRIAVFTLFTAGCVVATYLVPGEAVVVRRGNLGEPVAIAGMQIVADQVKLAKAVTYSDDDQDIIATSNRFVVVRMGVYGEVHSYPSRVQLRGASRTYNPYDGGCQLNTSAGFQVWQYCTFEVSTADLPGTLTLTLQPYLGIEDLPQLAEITLEISSAELADTGMNLLQVPPGLESEVP